MSEDPRKERREFRTSDFADPTHFVLVSVIHSVLVAVQSLHSLFTTCSCWESELGGRESRRDASQSLGMNRRERISELQQLCSSGSGSIGAGSSSSKASEVMDGTLCVLIEKKREIVLCACVCVRLCSSGFFDPLTVGLTLIHSDLCSLSFTNFLSFSSHHHHQQSRLFSPSRLFRQRCLPRNLGSSSPVVPDTLARTSLLLPCLLANTVLLVSATHHQTAE